MDKETETSNHKNEKNNTEMSNMLLSKNIEKERCCYKLDNVVRAWFNNKMMLLLMKMQYIQPRDSFGMMKSAFFLDEIEHHFIATTAPKSTRNAFRYLKRYMTVYPYVSKTHCERAFEMITRVYQGMGYQFNYVPSFTGYRGEITKLGRRNAGHNTIEEVRK
ncbi:MAG TPA: hypothetical protein PKV84_00310 [Candidatus Omnitrophota bacterium]|nr:hypothetical protein [Candidatus Omnitrophota bacterium]